MMTGFGMGFGVIGLFLFIVFIAVVVGLGILLVRALAPNNQVTHSTLASGEPNPKEILDRRYARGEITREQYQEMKQDIG